MQATDYAARSARDAQDSGYGGPDYWQYLEDHAHELHAYFLARGDDDRAREVMTRTLSDALAGNEGD